MMIKSNWNDKLDNYVKGIEDGSVISCDYIKMAVKKFKENIERKDLTFNEKEVEKIVYFIETLRHEKDTFAGKNFILSDWQIFILANIFGFYYKDGRRKHTDIYVEVARKNGKTHFIASILLYILTINNDSPEIILAANSREQAKVVDLEAVKSLINSIDGKKVYYKYNRNQVFTKFKPGILQVVSSDTKSLDGFNLSAFIIDEFHEATDFKMYNVLKSSQGNRTNPLRFIITTAGFSKKSPCYSIRSTNIEVLKGNKENDNIFTCIFTLDDGDDWKDSKNWIKSNPNLGITISEEFLRSEIEAAINNVDLEIGTKTKNLNIWCETSTRWIKDVNVLGVSKKFDFSFKEEGVNLYCAVDLSEVSDITSVSYMFKVDDILYFKNYYYLPYESLNSNYNQEYYKNQAIKGNIKLIDGNVIDYDEIIKDIDEINDLYGIDKLAYDRWNATEFYNKCEDIGFNMFEYPQTLGNFNRPTKELQRLILKGKVVIDDNEITRWMFENVVLRKDGNGNVKPDKSKSGNKIDGVISMLMALGTYLVDERGNISII
jgi:phage terminase large subunit-like protein